MFGSKWQPATFNYKMVLKLRMVRLGYMLCFGGVVLSIMIVTDVHIMFHWADPWLAMISQSSSAQPRKLETGQMDIPRCDVYQFGNELRIKGPHPNIPRHLIRNCSRVVYNRIPKCASRTMRDVFNIAGPFNNYTHIFIDKNLNAARFMELYMSEMKSVKNDRFVLTSHHYFVNFTQYLNQTIVFINVAREPSSWFMSIFNWQKYMSRGNRWWSKMQIGECIKSDGCVEAVLNLFGPMPFLCGPDEECRSNSKNALQRALQHVDRTYILVGIYEQLRDVTVVLEYLMPHMFSRLPQYFDVTAKEGNEKYKTAIKDNITTADLALLKRTLVFENELYAFIKQKFNRLLSIIKKEQ